MICNILQNVSYDFYTQETLCAFFSYIQEKSAPNCTCPCLPKCCPPHHVLSTSNPRLHGLSCQKANVNKLPQVWTVDNGGISRQAEPNTRYFHSVFPSCEGVSDDQNDTSNWDYVVHPENLFVLQPKASMEFILYTNREILNSNDLTNNLEQIFDNVSPGKVRIKKSIINVFTFHEYNYFL